MQLLPNWRRKKHNVQRNIALSWVVSHQARHCRLSGNNWHGIDSKNFSTFDSKLRHRLCLGQHPVGFLTKVSGRFDPTLVAAAVETACGGAKKGGAAVA